MFMLGVMDEASARILGLEGRRPRRPLRLSVRTTKGGTEKRRGTLKAHVFISPLLNQYHFPFFCNWHYVAIFTFGITKFDLIILAKTDKNYKPQVPHHLILADEGLK